MEYNELSDPSTNLLKLLRQQNDAGLLDGEFEGSEPFDVLVTKALFNAIEGGGGGGGGAVSSVNSYTGAVVLTKSDIGLGNVQNVDSTSASNLASGTIPDARFPATLPVSSGVNLTQLNATNLASGTIPSARFPGILPSASGVNLTSLNATQLTSGTIPDARFPSILPAISGANLTNLSVSSFSTGTLNAARLPAFTGDISTSQGSSATLLATVNSSPGTFGSATQVARFTVNGKGLITGVTNVTIAGVGSAGVSTVSITTANGISGTVANPTTTPAITLALGDITPNKVNGYKIDPSLGGLVISGLVEDTIGAAVANSAIIQAACVAEYKRRVYLPHGIFYIAGTIEMGTGTELFGCGGGAGDDYDLMGTVLVHIGTGLCIHSDGGLPYDNGYATSYAGGGIFNIRIVGNSGTTAGIRFTDVDLFKVHGCSFEGFTTGSAIQGYNYNSYSENVELYGNRTHGCKIHIHCHIAATITSLPGVLISADARFPNRSFSNWAIREHHSTMYIDGETLIKCDPWAQYYGGTTIFKNGFAHSSGTYTDKCKLVWMGEYSYWADNYALLYSERNTASPTFTRLKLDQYSQFSGTGNWFVAPSPAMSSFVGATDPIDDIHPTADVYIGTEGQIYPKPNGPCMLGAGVPIAAYKSVAATGDTQVVALGSGSFRLTLSYLGNSPAPVRHVMQLDIGAREGADLTTFGSIMRVEDIYIYNGTRVFSDTVLPYIKYRTGGVATPYVFVNVANASTDGTITATIEILTTSNIGISNTSKPFILFPDMTGVTVGAKAQIARYRGFSRIVVPSNNAVEARNEEFVTFKGTAGGVSITTNVSGENREVIWDGGDVKSANNLSELADQGEGRANLGFANSASWGNLGSSRTFDTRQGYQEGTLNTPCTIAFSNWPPIGRSRILVVRLQQNGAGNNTVSFTGVAIQPTVAMGANQITILEFFTNNAGTNIECATVYKHGQSLFASQNLADVGNPVTTRGNIGIGNVNLAGVLGAAALFDTRQDWHYGILDVDTTISFSNWAPSGSHRTIRLELKQDSFGGWDAFITGVVVQPRLNPNPNATTVIELNTRDGGTTVYARVVYPDREGVTTSNITVPSGAIIANTTVESVFTGTGFQPTMPILQTGDIVQYELRGVYSTDAIAPEISINLYLAGTVAVATGDVTMAAGITNLGWVMRGSIVVVSGTQVEAQGEIMLSTGETSALTVMMANTAVKTITASGGSFYTSARWLTADSDNSITCRQFIVKVLRA